MLPYIASDSLISFVFNSGLFIFYTIVAIAFFLVFFRYWSINKDKKLVLSENSFNVILEDIKNGTPSSLPLINNKKEYFIFIKLWSYKFENANGDERHNLLRFIKGLQLEKIIFEMLNHENDNYKIIAIKTLKHLKEQQFTPELYKSLKGKKPFLALLSAQSLIEIEPKTAIVDIIDFYLKNGDWVNKKILQILENTKEEHLRKVLLDKLKKSSTKQIVKIVKLFILIDEKIAYDESKKLITNYKDAKIIAASLGYINKEQDKTTLLSYTKHQSWEVRLSAIKSLTNMLIPDDINIISLLLSDETWVVRSYTAKALVLKNFAGVEYLDKLQSLLVDQQAKKSLKIARNRSTL